MQTSPAIFVIERGTVIGVSLPIMVLLHFRSIQKRYSVVEEKNPYLPEQVPAEGEDGRHGGIETDVARELAVGFRV